MNASIKHSVRRSRSVSRALAAALALALFTGQALGATQGLVDTAAPVPVAEATKQAAGCCGWGGNEL